jgi:ATP-dependent protease ClpP protease subunit
MKTWYAIRARAEGAEVSIYDEIGAFGVSAKGFLAELAALPEATPLTLRLNSPGGSVFDAVAIHNALKRHPGGVTVWIDGVAASAASYVAMAGATVIMPENAFLMIHDPAGMVMGPASDMRAMADALDKVKAALVSGYAAKSGQPPEEVARLMAEETWLDATDAVALGFADRVAEPVRMAARFDVARFRNAPPALVEAVEVEDAPAPAPEPETVPGGNGIDDTAAETVEDDDGIPAAETLPDRKGIAADAAPAAHTPDLSPPDAAAIRATALVHARAVVDLCRLAGKPEMAAGFLAEDASLDAVRAALLATRAEDAPDIDPRHAQPGRKPAASPWGEVIARTFRTVR